MGLARIFRTLDPEMKNPRSEHWEKIEEIYGILL
ncbi:MAG: DUF1931 family protein [Alphaproteobacteria bacterium]|nr:MAG: DUF1931 family protein [Alphaproteobacteria bacterium]